MCPTWRAEIIEECGVGVNVINPFVGNVIFVEDGFDWTSRFAGTAVYTFIWVNVEAALTLIDAVDGAFFDAGSVHDINAGLCDNVRHWYVTSPWWGRIKIGGQSPGAG